MVHTTVPHTLDLLILWTLLVMHVIFRISLYFWVTDYSVPSIMVHMSIMFCPLTLADEA